VIESHQDAHYNKRKTFDVGVLWILCRTWLQASAEK